MGIRNMLRKVFGRDREDSPATSVPPQSRETEETAETAEAGKTAEAVPASEPVTSPEAPEEVRRAADDLVAASFDNPQVPKARSAEPEPEPVEVAPAPAETSAVEPVETPESVEPVEAETPVLSAAAEAAERDAAAAAAPGAEPVEVSLPEERNDETGLSAEVEAVEISYPEPPAEPEAEPAVAEAPEAETAVAEAPAEPKPEPAVAETPESEPAVAETVTPEPEPETATAEAPEPAVTETPAEPETAAEPEPEPVVVAAPAPEASAPEAPAPVPTPETPVITALEPEAPEVSEAPEVPEVAAPVAAGPALSLAKVKAAAPHLADAYKAAGTVLKKQGLTGARAAVYLVVDRSGSMRGYFKDGSVQRLAEQTVALAAHLDENAAVTAVFFSTDIDGTAELTPATLSPTGIEEINAGLGRLGRTHYHRAVEEVLAHHEKTDPARPALVVFQTDGAPDAKTAATQALAGAADRPLHWRFVAWGEQDNKAFDYLRKLGGTPRTAAYFPGAAPAGTAHAAFYRGLLEGLEL
ncbi:VWA domain-containing protein [Streptomyces sp. NPDC093088]|uniref:VWA domain-containing protein n=1 Tax=Streptomyces sp. NPDC093088 TaxID=3366023 RepID=UPI00381B3965